MNQFIQREVLTRNQFDQREGHEEDADEDFVRQGVEETTERRDLRREATRDVPVHLAAKRKIVMTLCVCVCACVCVLLGC